MKLVNIENRTLN